VGKNTEPEELSRNTVNGRSGYKHPRNYGWEPRVNNRRLIFSYIIQSSPEVTDSIKKLADAPIETVLNMLINLQG